jgi:Tol biopolymer transport system component
MGTSLVIARFAAAWQTADIANRATGFGDTLAARVPMNRTLLAMTITSLILSSNRCLAQATTNLPVIRPKVTDLGEIHDSTLTMDLAPDDAALSPRGTLVAYTTNNDLRMWNVNARSSRVVLKGWSQGPEWSPSGDAIVFVHGGEGSHDDIWTLRVNPVTGEPIGSPQRLSLSPVTGGRAHFSPDGKTIAFARLDSGTHSSLVVVPAAGGTERVVASANNYIGRLRWAADGRLVYYVVFTDSGRTAVLSKVAVGGGAPQIVHEFSGFSEFVGEGNWPVMSADNRVVILPGSTVGVERTTRIADPAGRVLGTLSTPPGVGIADGGANEYRQLGVREAYPRSLRVVNVATGKTKELIDSAADVQAVTWFQDSRRFAAIVFDHDVGVLVTMDADGTGVRKIPLNAEPSRSQGLFAPPVEKLRVSPDGRYAVYLANGHTLGGTDLELVDLLTGKQRTLVRDRSITQPFWLRDSRTIRYMRGAEVPITDTRWLSTHDVSIDGTDSLVRQFPKSKYPYAVWLMGENFAAIFRGATYSLARFDGSPDQLLLRAAIPSPGAISPNGRTIAVSPGTEQAYRKLILVSTSDGSQRAVDLPFPGVGCGPFSPDGRYIYCKLRESDSSPQLLYEFPVDGSSTPRVVSRSDSREIRGAIAMSPDGKWMLETVSGPRRTEFVSLDFTDGMTRLLSSATKR